MNPSLITLFQALKRLIKQLNPQINPLSFLIITGKKNHGVSTLLKKTLMQQIQIDGQPKINLYYNTQGIILEMNESWLDLPQSLMQRIIKKLNQCHRFVKISGMILCVDASDLLQTRKDQLMPMLLHHQPIIEELSKQLGKAIPIHLILTKLDAISGFLDFFDAWAPKNPHETLGFVFDPQIQDHQLVEDYLAQFTQFIQEIESYIIHHLDLSSLERTPSSMENFPSDLDLMKTSLEPLIRQLSWSTCQLQAIYFTSAQQNSKIIHEHHPNIEYFLSLAHPLFHNKHHRSYFVQGAILSALNRNQQSEPPLDFFPPPLHSALAITAILGAFWINHQYGHIFENINWPHLLQNTQSTTQPLENFAKASKIPTPEQASFEANFEDVSAKSLSERTWKELIDDEEPELKAPKPKFFPHAPEKRNTVVNPEPPVFIKTEQRPSLNTNPVKLETNAESINLSAQELHDKKINKALSAIQVGQDQLAIKLLRKTLEEFPNSTEARENLAALYILHHYKDQAMHILDEGLEKESDNTHLITMKARILFDEGKAKEALEIMEKFNPDINTDSEYYGLFAALLQSLKHHHEAQLWYQLLVQIEPENPQYWFGLAVTSEHNHATDQAIEAYKKTSENLSIDAKIRSYALNRINLLQG